jgi:hypothetical protein
VDRVIVTITTSDGKVLQNFAVGTSDYGIDNAPHMLASRILQIVKTRYAERVIETSGTAEGRDLPAGGI